MSRPSSVGIGARRSLSNGSPASLAKVRGEGEGEGERERGRGLPHQWGRLWYANYNKRKRERVMNKVVIEVLGGVAYVKSASEGIEVEIIDYDNAEREGE